jgi:hypothetical protein
VLKLTAVGGVGSGSCEVSSPPVAGALLAVVEFGESVVAGAVVALPPVVVAAGNVEGAGVVTTGDVTSVTPGPVFEGMAGATPTFVAVADG